MLKRLLVAAAFVVVAGSMVGMSTVNAADNSGKEKVSFCHAKPADTAKNGWNKLSTAKEVVYNSGHPQHAADIIPPFSYTKQGNLFNFPGLNWDAEGQAIFNNNCALPDDEEPVAVIDFKLVCDVNNHQAVITFTNTGGAEGSATVNGSLVNIPLTGAMVNVPTAVAGTQVTIVIDDEQVLNELVTCEPGKGAGGETPTTPATPAAATPAASLPFTANNTPVVALVASAIATVTAVVSVIVKSALVKQL